MNRSDRRPTIVSFTGTRKGLSPVQRDQFRLLVAGIGLNLRACEWHVGGADGADVQATDIMLQAGATPERMHIHPCPGVTLDKLAAVFGRDVAERFHWHEVFPPLVRNRHMAEVCWLLVAAPETDVEQLRSGTWATVRYARKASKPVVMLSRGNGPGAA